MMYGIRDTKTQEVLFYGLSEKGLVSILHNSNVSYEFAEGVRIPKGLCAGSLHNLNHRYIVVEDVEVGYQFDTVTTDEGEGYHQIFTFPNGDKIHKGSGDWVSPRPDASTAPMSRTSALKWDLI